MPWSWHPQISPTLPLCSVMSDTCSLLREVVKKRTHISYGQVKKGSKRVQKRAKKNFTKCKHGKHKRFTVHLLDHHQTKPDFPPITVFIHFNWFLIEMAACVQKEFLAHFLLIWSVLYLAGGETGLWRIVWVFYYFDFFCIFVFCILLARQDCDELCGYFTIWQFLYFCTLQFYKLCILLVRQDCDELCGYFTIWQTTPSLLAFSSPQRTRANWAISQTEICNKTKFSRFCPSGYVLG